MELLNKIRGYRTLIVNVLVLVIAALVAIGALPAAEFAGVTEEVVGEQFDTLALHVESFIASLLAILALTNGALRFITKGPVGNKDAG